MNHALQSPLSHCSLIALRKEFELDSRYNDLSLKLNIINEDAR